MRRRDKLIAWIHEELCRIGCREIRFTGAGGAVDGVFSRDGRTVVMPLELAHRTLFVVPSYSGDDAAWASLADWIRGEEGQAGFRGGARPL